MELLAQSAGSTTRSSVRRRNSGGRDRDNKCCRRHRLHIANFSRNVEHQQGYHNDDSRITLRKNKFHNFNGNKEEFSKVIGIIARAAMEDIVPVFEKWIVTGREIVNSGLIPGDIEKIWT
jgi:hypothetical protein